MTPLSYLVMVSTYQLAVARVLNGSRIANAESAIHAGTNLGGTDVEGEKNRQKGPEQNKFDKAS